MHRTACPVPPSRRTFPLCDRNSLSLTEEGEWTFRFLAGLSLPQAMPPAGWTELMDELFGTVHVEKNCDVKRRLTV